MKRIAFLLVLVSVFLISCEKEMVKKQETQSDVYFRVEIIDKDGNSEFSQIKVVKF